MSLTSFAQESGTTGVRGIVHFLKTNYIKEFTVLGQGDDPLKVKLLQVNINSLQAREEAAVRQSEVEAERIGNGVTQESQDILDALSKTMLPVKEKATTAHCSSIENNSDMVLPRKGKDLDLKALKYSKVLSTSIQDDAHHRVVDDTKKRAASQNVDYDTFAAMVPPATVT